MPPRLPSRPSHDADRLSVSWVSQLLDCLKYAMEYPIGDRKSIMRTPSGTLQTISQNSLNNNQEAAIDPRKGMFKVINTSDENEQKIKIVNSFDLENENCGRIQVNSFMVDVPVTELIISAESYVYLEAVLIGQPATNAIVTIKQQTEKLGYEASIAKQLASHVTFSTGKITDFSEEFISQQMMIIGACTYVAV